MISYVRRLIESIKSRKKSFKAKARYKELKDKMKPTDDYEELVVWHRAKRSGEMIYNADYKHAIFAIKNLIYQAMEDKSPILIYGYIPAAIKQEIIPMLKEIKELTVDVLFSDTDGKGFVVVGEYAYYLYNASTDKASLSFNRPGIAGTLAKEFKLRKDMNIKKMNRKHRL